MTDNERETNDQNIQVGCGYIAPRVWWAVWAIGSHAPPCIAGTKIDAEELRDDDELALPLLVVSPEWAQALARDIAEVEALLPVGLEFSQVGFRLLTVRLALERAVGG